MRVPCMLAAALSLAMAATAQAGDLAKIERRIAKEPAYQTKSPSYCLLVFGLDARTRVWLVQDGDRLYVDKNGDGDLTGQGECIKAGRADENGRMFDVGEITVGGLTHTGLTVAQMKASADWIGNAEEWKRVSQGGAREPWIWWVRITAERAEDDQRDLPRKVSYVINGDGEGMLLFAAQAQEAPIIHLNGPFTLALQDRRQSLVAGGEKMLQIGVGPRGVGPGTFAFVLYPNTIPNDVYPEVEITFPASPGAEAVKQRYTLKQRC